jgi:hypothetical protein
MVRDKSGSRNGTANWMRQTEKKSGSSGKKRNTGTNKYKQAGKLQPLHSPLLQWHHD